MIDATHDIAIGRQAELLAILDSNVHIPDMTYFKNQPIEQAA